MFNRTKATNYKRIVYAQLLGKKCAKTTLQP